MRVLEPIETLEPIIEWCPITEFWPIETLEPIIAELLICADGSMELGIIQGLVTESCRISRTHE